MLREALESSFFPELISGVIAAITTLIGFAARYHRSAQRRKQRQLDMACEDIAFLLSLEAKYVFMLNQRGVEMDPNIKVAMRNHVREEGFVFSGRFTPGRVAARKAERGLKPVFRRIRANIEAMPEESEPA